MLSVISAASPVGDDISYGYVFTPDGFAVEQ